MAVKLGPDPARMQRRGPHPARLVPAVELHREQDIRGLGTAIGNIRLVGRALEIRVVQIDIRRAVTVRRHIHQPSAGGDQPRDAVHQHEMADMVGAELRFETIHRVPVRRAHDAGIGDHGIEFTPIGQQRIGAGAHAFQR